MMLGDCHFLIYTIIRPRGFHMMDCLFHCVGHDRKSNLVHGAFWEGCFLESPPPVNGYLHSYIIITIITIIIYLCFVCHLVWFLYLMAYQT